MPKCYAYGRASTSKQGMTQDVQEKMCRDYYDTHLVNRGIEWGGFFYDSATSGGTIFSEREQGRLLYFSLKKGDYLVVSAMDRLFRNKRDGFVTLDELDRLGVKRVVLDLPDLSGLEGDAELFDMLESNMVLYAHMYRRMLSRKMKRDNQVKRDNGIPYSRSAPMGWKLWGDRKRREYRVNHDERKVIDFMQSLSDDGMSHEEIALWYCHAEDKGQFRTKTMRRFTDAAIVRWALRARIADYPLITNRPEFTNKWSRGELRHVTRGSA